MKRHNAAASLAIENPPLFEKVKEAFNRVLPEIQTHVEQTLSDQNFGTVAVHATFLRIEDTDKKEILFIETEAHFIKMPLKILSRLVYVNFYDTFEEYERERLAISNKNTKPGQTTQYKGKQV